MSDRTVYYYQDVPCHAYGLEDGEIEWSLTFSIVPYFPGNYWEPPEGGIEPDQLFMDGKEVEIDDYPDEYDELCQRAWDAYWEEKGL